MRILLVKPHYKGIYGRLKNIATEYPHLGLLYLASYVKNSNEVRILDMSAENITETDYRRVLEDYHPDVVGFTVTTPLSRYSHELAGIAKEIVNNVIVVFGGPHPTAVPEEELEDPNVDFVVRGEGEVSFGSLLDSEFKNLNRIFGISYRNNGGIVHNPQQEYITNLDALPFPAYDLIDIQKYYFVDARKHPLAPLLSSRGCPYRCVYCNKNIFGYKYRARSPKNIVDEIEFLINNYKVKEVHILDDGFTTIPKRAIEVCNEIKDRGIDILLDCANGIRADKVDSSLLSKMKDAGFYKVAFGIESGDQGILNIIHKDITIDKVRHAVKIAKNAGLEVWGFFMIGIPGESRETVEKTVDFAIDLNLDAAKFYITTPLPGTELFNDWKSKGYIKSFDWENYNFYSSPVYQHPNLSPQELMELHKYCFKKFYFRPRYILKRLKTSYSIHHLCQNIRAGMGMLALVGKK